LDLDRDYGPSRFGHKFNAAQAQRRIVDQTPEEIRLVHPLGVADRRHGQKQKLERLYRQRFDTE
jgi:hypothetical protein